MSSNEQAILSLLSHLALSFDGGVLGAVLTYAAVRSVLKFTASSAALRRLRKAPSVSIADLRSVLAADHPPDDSPPPLVVVRGTVETRAAVDGAWKSLRNNALVSSESGDKAVLVQRTQTCIYNEWKGFFGLTSDLRTIFARSWREQNSTSLRSVPFVLVETGNWPVTDLVTVNIDGSRHPLPLKTVYHELQPVNTTPYTFLQALFGHEYPVGLLDEEKILPPGQEITAVGICSLKNGIPEIKSCKDIPYFLTEMSKEQMIIELAFSTKVLLFSGIVLGSLSIGILGYAAVRNWNRWKNWRQTEQLQQEPDPTEPGDESEIQISSDDTTFDIPDGQLCVICLARRRRSAFIPCGHLVCCQQCSLLVAREVTPKCPVCRQKIRTSVRIYDS